MSQIQQPVNKFQKLILILLATGILTYFTAGFFGRVEGYFFDDFGPRFGTIEAIRYIFGLFIAPTFFLSFFLFLFVDRKTEFILFKTLFVILGLVVLVNLGTGLASIIFSAVFIACGYGLAQLVLLIKRGVGKGI